MEPAPAHPYHVQACRPMAPDVCCVVFLFDKTKCQHKDNNLLNVREIENNEDSGYLNPLSFSIMVHSLATSDCVVFKDQRNMH